MKRKTHEEFKQEVYDLVNEEYSILSKYVKSSIKIKIKHNVCGHEYLVSPTKFLQGQRCPKCKRPNYNRNTELFIKEVYELVGDEYTVLGEYTGVANKILMKHNVCGHEWNVNAGSFLRGVRCPKCKGGIPKTHNEFIKEVYDLIGEEYSILDEYTNSQTKIKMQHNICGYIFERRPNDFLQGQRCSYCAGLVKKTTEYFKSEVNDLTNGEYEVVGDYINAHTKISMKHCRCNHIYEVIPNAFLRGNRCPRCSSSKGEKIIYDLLNKYSITYETQFKINNCRYKKTLPFDFAIFKNNKLILLIEYDGVQHFKPRQAFGGKKEFEQVKIRDNIKTKYCRDNNIHLLRIPYWKFDNINKIILKKLFRLGLI